MSKPLDAKAFKVFFRIVLLAFFLSFMSVGVTNSLTLPSQEHIVEISVLRFRPASLTVHSGDVVKWVNRDNRRHQLMSISVGGWRSRILKPGDSFIQFIGKTTFYICMLHPNMQGKILIQGR